MESAAFLSTEGSKDFIPPPFKVWFKFGPNKVAAKAKPLGISIRGIRL